MCHVRFVLTSVTVMVVFIVNRVVAQDFCSVGVPGQILCDDFSDLSLTNNLPLDVNGNPVRWSANDPNFVSASAETGNLVYGGQNVGSVSISIDDLVLQGDASIRTQAKMNDGSGIGLGTGGHYTFLNESGSAFIVRTEVGEQDTVLARSDNVPFDPNEQLMWQFDIIDDKLSLWIWRPDEPLPSEPVLSVTDTPANQRVVLLGSGESRVFFGEHRFVQVATQSIPEPSTAVLSCLGLLSLLAWRRRS